jgi:DNA replication protein DnaC
MSKIWKVAQPEDNRIEGFEEYTCSQGWHGGDLSWLFYNYRDENNRINDCTEAVNSFMYSDKKVVNLLWEKEPSSLKRANNAFRSLMKKINSSDIILLYNGKLATHIGEIPDEFLYHYNSNLLFPNAIFPVKYYEIETVFGVDNKIKKGSAQGIKGIEEYGGDQNYIIENWIDFKQKEGITNVFPEEKRTQYNGLIKRMPEAIENSRETILQKYNMMKTEPYIELLKSNKNIVLTGAPGTGKTYLAKEIAKQMTGTKADETNEQYAFVQFHPSYDYTDFVEGLRPIKNKNDKELGFELKNGIFKEFCKKAKDDPKDNKYVFVIDEINRAEISKVFGELFYAIDPEYRGEDGKVKTQYSNMQTEETRFNDNDDYFYVPKNVYIIGTMNDIDRSVESFDFALRRRFAWKEIAASERVEMWVGNDWKDEAGVRMEALNNAIFSKGKEKNTGIDGLNSSYHIGPAYFLKLNNYKKEEKPWDKLWENHLEVLLREYLRGMPDAETKLSELKKAYNKEK